MKYDIIRLRRCAFAIYAALNLFAYVFAHTAYLFANDIIGLTFEYVSFYLSRILEFISPPLIATLGLCVYLNEGKKNALSFVAVVASARVFYLLPYYYIVYIYNYAYDSVESILLSFFSSAMIILFTVLGSLISIALVLVILSRVERKRGLEAGDGIRQFSKKRSGFDFLKPECLPLLIFALLRFSVSLLMELIDTVSFFIEYKSDFTPGEIITILTNYLLLFILLVLSYLLCIATKNKITDIDSPDKTVTTL